MSIERERAVDLLRGLVSIGSLSGTEQEATTWLVDQLQILGLDRAHIDDAGNAVGEIGKPGASRTAILLGHIDTVPGEIDVRIERSGGRERLFGRGSVDAKGPLAAFCSALARLGSKWAQENDVRLIVAGAVEEESASSRGARHLCEPFDCAEGQSPQACIIGEPSGWNRVTLGYKGRLLVDLEASRALTHTAGPDPGITTTAVELWNTVRRYCDEFNVGKERAFDQLLASLRSIESSSDGLTETVEACCGIRLPIDFDPTPLMRELAASVADRLGAELPAQATPIDFGQAATLRLEGENGTAALSHRGFEPAYRGDSKSALVTCFRGAIRNLSPYTRPGLVVKTGTSDMNVVGPAWECPILAYGPGDSSLDHTPNEHIWLDEYWHAVLVVEEAMRRWAAIES